MLDHRDLVTSLPLSVSELFTVSKRIEEVETTHIPVETPTVNTSSQGCTTLSGINSVSLDLGTANQMGQATSLSVSQISFNNPFTLGSFLRPPPLLKSGSVGMRPQFPLVSQPLSGLPGVPGGFIPLIFPMLPVNPRVPSMGSGGAFPLLATGSVRPVISLPSMQLQSSVANPAPPSSTGSSQLSLEAVSDPSLVVEVEEEMDASCSMLHSTFSEAGVTHE